MFWNVNRFVQYNNTYLNYIITIITNEYNSEVRRKTTYEEIMYTLSQS